MCCDRSNDETNDNKKHVQYNIINFLLSNRLLFFINFFFLVLMTTTQSKSMFFYSLLAIVYLIYD